MTSRLIRFIFGILKLVFLILSTFLHNIYYRYISKSYKKAQKYLENGTFSFSFHADDARKSVAALDKTYNYIFLDAFTPSKCPCLWTLEFFRLLYDRLEPGGKLLTYSQAAPVRNAMLQAGFRVGKTSSGTVAVKNPALIKTPLTEYDLGLLKTRAGIVYRDETLSLENEAIIAAHKKEREESNLMTTSRYIKSYRP